MAQTETVVEVPTVETVWREFGEALQSFIRRRIADQHRADDVLGDVLLRIHGKLSSVVDHDRLASWVFQVARNAITDEYRRTARRREQLDPAAGSYQVGDDGASWGDEDNSVLSELAECMRPLLSQLAEPYRRAIELTDLGGMTQVHAAEAEGISVSGMKSRVQRGRRHLQEILTACCSLTLDARGFPVDYTAPDGCNCG